jgi:hypothetical protein
MAREVKNLRMIHAMDVNSAAERVKVPLDCFNLVTHVQAALFLFRSADHDQYAEWPC